MKEINQVHFTLGDNAGILLMQIAQEALLCELDPEKAVKVITTSLMGCPNNIALKILKGDMVCEVTDDMQNIEVVDYKEEFHKDYPKPNLTDWYERNHKDIGDNGREFYTALEQVIRFVNKQDIEIPIKDVVSLVLSSTMKDWEALRSKLSHMEDIERIILLVNQCSKFMDRTAKLYRVFDFIDSVYPDVSCNLSRGMHMENTGCSQTPEGLFWMMIMYLWTNWTLTCYPIIPIRNLPENIMVRCGKDGSRHLKARNGFSCGVTMKINFPIRFIYLHEKY